MIDRPSSITPQASTIADKPDPYNPSKRKGYLSWDDYFMAIAFLSAKRSKDPNRQVGACIVSQDRVILGIGYNGFPRGCSDDHLPWAKKSATGDPLQTKYPYVCHAEVNAILNKNHASASGQRLYVTLFPCNECAKIIIQAGIAEVVYYTDKGAHIDNNAGVLNLHTLPPEGSFLWLESRCGNINQLTRCWSSNLDSIGLASTSQHHDDEG